MAVEARRQVLRMLAAVEIDRAVAVRAADVEDVGNLRFGQLQELGAVGRQPLARSARWLAARVRLELVAAAIVGDRARPVHVRDRRARPGAGAAATTAAARRCCAWSCTAWSCTAWSCGTRSGPRV